MLFYGTVKDLITLLAGRTEDVALDLAALQLAAIECPGLDVAHYVRMMDEHASVLASRPGGLFTGPSFVAAANEYFFSDLGFYGNEADYYNPRNSCLNDVLDRHTGIPITLSVLYLEVARRLGRPVYGIGLPGHFLVQYNDGRFSTYIDVFGGGALLTPERCRELALKVSGIDIRQNPALLHPASKRQILLRMLNNLRGIYVSRQSWRKALTVLDLLIVALPHSPDEYRQRGVLNVELDRFGAARQDFETYLRLSPQALDRNEVERQLLRLRSQVASQN